MTTQPSEKRNQTRQKPGSTGKGDYYHIEILPKAGFVTFRTQDVGEQGHIQRVAGKRASGSWATVKWLVGKQDAHIKGDKLVADTKGAKNLLKELGSQPVHMNGDRFKAAAKSKTSSAPRKKAGVNGRRVSKTSASSKRK